MNPTPESQPPESEPPSIPPAVAAPVMNADSGTLWRKILWVVLATVITAPLALLAGYITWFFLLIFLSLSMRPFGGHWSVRAEDVIILIAAVVGFAVPVSVARQGLKRGWHNSRVLVWGWSCVALVALLIFVFAVPAFQKVRQSSQDKAIPLRALSAAADQYFLENGVSTVDYAHLVGATNYVKAVNTVADETYPVYYTQGITITVTGVAGARTVTYSP